MSQLLGHFSCGGAAAGDACADLICAPLFVLVGATLYSSTGSAGITPFDSRSFCRLQETALLVGWWCVVVFFVVIFVVILCRVLHKKSEFVLR